MDNAAGADQVRPLIPPEGCLLLVTSRFYFHLPGFQVKDLDEMPPEDARALLLQIAPRIGEQAERIAAACASVPFALRQAAGTLAERPDLSPASYASRLESGTAKLGLIEARSASWSGGASWTETTAGIASTTSRGSSRTAVAVRRNVPERSVGTPSTTGVFWSKPTTSISKAARICSAVCG